MIIPDVNVLIALFRPEHPNHQAAREWWNTSAESGVPVTVPDLVWVGFVRITTNRRIFSVPATADEAWEFVRSVLGEPTYLHYAHHPRLLSEFESICSESQAAGDLVTDAYIAATARVLGAAVATFDRDFRRFDDLRLVEIA